jgi:isoleucyl-tRNA synthetase
MAPFAPFVGDAIYRNLTDGTSVHLSDFPESVGREDLQLESDMARARQAVETGLAARDALRLKVRQPLAGFASTGDPLNAEIETIVLDELNVKALTYGAPEPKLDSVITEPLKLEGMAREVVRIIQDRRKKLGFNVEDRIDARYDADGLLARALEHFADYIKTETLSVTLAAGRDGDFAGEQMMIEGEQIWIGLKRRA